MHHPDNFFSFLLGDLSVQDVVVNSCLGALGNLLWLIIGGTIVFVCRNLNLAFLSRLWHLLVKLVTRRPYVLIWNDVDYDSSRSVARALQRRLPQFRYVSLRIPKTLENYLPSTYTVAGVILIVTDVTKFSEEEKIRQRMIKLLDTYVMRGGGLVGTHDIVYRRVRNDQLQHAFGVIKMDNFKRMRKGKLVDYYLNKQMGQHTITLNLPEHFALDDREVVFGEWKTNTIPIYYSGKLDEKTTPLVVINEPGGRGKVVWMNTGDYYKKEAPPSMVMSAGPRKYFLQLLVNSLLWFTEKWPTVEETCSTGLMKNLTLPIVIAHRGMPANVDARENTLESFDMAIRVGADMIELDVRRSRDGQILVHHDEKVESGNRSLLIASADYEQLLELADYPIPTLEEVLIYCAGKIALLIELKETGLRR